MKKNEAVLICSLPINNNLGGETIKSQYLYDYLNRNKKNIKLLELSSLKEKKLLLLFKLFKILINPSIKKIYICKSSFTAYKILKVLTIFKKDIYYFVIGGEFHNYLKNDILLKKYYFKTKKIYVESKKMKNELHELGLYQTEYLPNFKEFDQRSYKERKVEKPLKCIFFSRIVPEKGTEMLFKMLEKYSDFEINIDFYGPIDENYKNEFMKKIKKFSNSKYKGILDLKLQKNYEIIENYDVMIFPTYWKGEGFPGVLIDSFIAGVPILASDWNYNNEIIKENTTGFLFEAKNQLEFEKKIKYILNNLNLLKEMRKKCYEESLKYKVENVLKTIKYDIEGE